MSGNKLFKKTIFVILSLLICANSFQVFASNVQNNFVAMDFEQYNIGDAPTGFKNCSIEEYEGDNAAKISVGKLGVTNKVDKIILGEYCLSFDIASPNDRFNGKLQIMSGGEFKTNVLTFDNGVISTYNGKALGKVGNTFKKINVVINPSVKNMKVYIGNKCLISRFYISTASEKCTSVLFTFSGIEQECEVYLDNIILHSTMEKVSGCSIYNPEGYVELPKIVKITDETKYEKDDKQREQLKNKVTLHTRSGVMYKNGVKSRLEVMPYIKNDEIMVPAEGIEWLFDSEVNPETGTVTYSDKVYDIRNLAEEKDGIWYLPFLEIVQNKFGYYVYTDDTTVSSGMVVAGKEEFYPPVNEDELQALNDFIFYRRPAPEDILSDYRSSPSFGVHPRIMLTPKDAERIREEVKTNEVKKEWYERLIAQCDKIMESATLVYEFRDGVRLMYVADDFEKYMLMLGMAYQISGDKKYADAAWKHIESVSSFPDWNPAHHIDVGIMAVGYAVAYDWMYDCWTDEQKEIMEKAVYNNCFYIANETYKGGPEDMDGVINQQNHNVICNGGISMSALAFIDVYPEISAKLVSDATRCLEYMIHNFAPYGAWYEGPSYAGMTIDYTVRMLSAYDTALNNLYCMDMVEGINLAGEYLTYVQSDVSCFNFADAEYGYSSSAGLFWLFDYFDMKGMKEPLRMTERYTTNYDDSLVHCLQWYSTEEESDAKAFGLDKRYEGTEIITMRNTYDEGQVFVGVKAGDTVYDHSQLDSGSFVFDALGVRWAHDMGKDDYNLSGYFGMDGPRWNIFRMRSESHNTIVINPVESPNYVIGARADVLSFEQKPRGTITKIDMGKVLADNVNDAKRGYLFTNDRTALVVRDEINLKKESDVYWFMYTKADAEINGTSVILTDRDDKSKQITIDFASSHPGEVYFEAATPLETCPTVVGQLQNDGFYRLVYKMKASSKASITAKLTPVGYPSEDIKKYDTSIDSWTIPDGDPVPPPTVDRLVIGGNEYDVSDKFIMLECENDESPVPEIEAFSDEYVVEIEKADSVMENSYVYLFKSETPELKTKYTISYNPKKLKRVIEGYDVAEISSVRATEEPEVENIAANVIDGKMDTRWSAQNEQQLYLELEEVTEIDAVFVSMYLGDSRTTAFDIYISEDGVNYQNVHKGSSSGTTRGYEGYEFDKAKVKYIRIDFHGASNTTWNSVSEVVAARKK